MESRQKYIIKNFCAILSYSDQSGTRIRERWHCIEIRQFLVVTQQWVTLGDPAWCHFWLAMSSTTHILISIRSHISTQPRCLPPTRIYIYIYRERQRCVSVYDANKNYMDDLRIMRWYHDIGHVKILINDFPYTKILKTVHMEIGHITALQYKRIYR